MGSRDPRKKARRQPSTKKYRTTRAIVSRVPNRQRRGGERRRSTAGKRGRQAAFGEIEPKGPSRRLPKAEPPAARAALPSLSFGEGTPGNRRIAAGERTPRLYPPARVATPDNRSLFR